MRSVTRLGHVSPLARMTARSAPPHRRLVVPWNSSRHRSVLYVSQHFPAARLVTLLAQGPPQLRLVAVHPDRTDKFQPSCTLEYNLTLGINASSLSNGHRLAPDGTRQCSVDSWMIICETSERKGVEDNEDPDKPSACGYRERQRR